MSDYILTNTLQNPILDYQEVRIGKYYESGNFEDRKISSFVKYPTILPDEDHEALTHCTNFVDAVYRM